MQPKANSSGTIQKTLVPFLENLILKFKGFENDIANLKEDLHITKKKSDTYFKAYSGV